MKQDFPLERVRRWLEPGPVVLVSSRWRGRDNVMTLGWQTVLAFQPSLVGLMISDGNHSHRMIRDSGVCVINLPLAAMADQVVGIGNTTGAQIDKFAEFGLTRVQASRIDAPMIAEAHANFECRLVDDTLVESRGFFVFEVVRAHVEERPEHPRTLHYMGQGRFMVSGEVIDKSDLFRPEMLGP